MHNCPENLVLLFRNLNFLSQKTEFITLFELHVGVHGDFNYLDIIGFVFFMIVEINSNLKF